MNIYTVKQPEPNKRRITVRALWARVTDVKYGQLIEMAKTDSLLEARIDMINRSKPVFLDYPLLRTAFAELKEAGFFTEEEETRIFADAQLDEMPD